MKLKSLPLVGLPLALGLLLTLALKSQISSADLPTQASFPASTLGHLEGRQPSARGHSTKSAPSSDGSGTTPIGDEDDRAMGIAFQKDAQMVASGYSHSRSDDWSAMVRINRDAGLGTASGAQSANYALRFDGIDDFVRIVNPTGTPSGNNPYTIEFWAKADQWEGKNRHMVAVGDVKSLKRDVSVAYHYTGWGGGGHPVGIYVVHFSADWSTGVEVVTDQWYHFAATYDGTTERFYVNGELRATGGYNGFDIDSSPIIIGAQAWDGLPSDEFDGVIDEVRIWNAARSDAEIAEHYNKTLTGTETGLVAYYRFDEGTGQNLTDATTNHNDGQLGLAPGSDGSDPAWIPSTAPLPKLKLLFVPLRWQGTQEDFDAEVDTQVDFFLRDIPLGGCREKVQWEKLDVATQGFDNWTCANPWGWQSVDLWRIRLHVWNLGIKPSDYDIVVGLVEDAPCKSDGESNNTDTVWIEGNVESKADHVLAHEVGHIFGLVDEYCSIQAGSTDSRCNDGDSQGDGAATGSVNWLDAAMPFDCPPDGSPDSHTIPCCNYNDDHICSQVGYSEAPCCYGNLNSRGGRATMSFTGAELDALKRGYDDHSIAHLSSLPELSCSSTPSALVPGSASRTASDDTILEVNLLVHRDDSVDEKLIAFTKGRPTFDSVLQSQAGDYSLKVVDSNDVVLWSQSFPLYFDYSGPVYLGVDYSGISYDARFVSYRIGYSHGMDTLRLYHGDDLISSKELPAHTVYLPIVLRGQ